MSNHRCITLMMFDHDRYFTQGIMRFLQHRYPYAVIRRMPRQVKTVDVLLTGMDAVSLCASQHFAQLMTAGSQLLVVHGPSDEGWRYLPPGLRQQSARYLHRGASLEQLARLLDQIIPDTHQMMTIIDPRSIKEDVLTPREKTLLAHMRFHLTPHQIAESMDLHPKTISTYKRSVMLKLGMQKNVELYHWLFYSSASDVER